MFRPMVRFKQQISEEECIRVLKEQKRGVLSMIGDDGYPYGVPINHWYCEEDGKLYFHGGLKGHRIDAIERCDKVSFCVYDEGYKKDGEWALNVNSVIVFGRIAKVTDREKMIRICSDFTIFLLIRQSEFFGKGRDGPKQEHRRNAGEHS